MENKQEKAKRKRMELDATAHKAADLLGEPYDEDETKYEQLKRRDAQTIVDLWTLLKQAEAEIEGRMMRIRHADAAALAGLRRRLVRDVDHDKLRRLAEGALDTTNASHVRRYSRAKLSEDCPETVLVLLDERNQLLAENKRLAARVEELESRTIGCSGCGLTLEPHGPDCPAGQGRS